MSPLLRPVLALAVAVSVAACDRGPVGRMATHRVTGTVTAEPGSVVDWDVADPATLTAGLRRSNDDRTHAQPLPSAVTVGGWVSVSTATYYDPVDFYEVALAQGQRITFVPAAPGPVQLEVCLENVNAPGTATCPAPGATGTTVIDVPASGTYLVEVSARTGGSLYTLTIGAGAASAAAAEPELVPGEVIVTFREPGSGGARTLPERARALGLQLLAGDAAGRPALVGLGDAPGRARALALLGVEPPSPDSLGAPLDPVAAARLDTLRAVRALRARADVESADPNYVLHPSYVPDDALYRYQWSFPAIQLPQAWDVTKGAVAGNPTPIVAVVDTGVFLAHPDLQGQLVPGYDFISDPAQARDGDGVDPNPDDPGDSATLGRSTFHGTHVAGTIAAVTGNGTGVAGVAFQAKVMPVRALGVGGGTSFDIMQGVLWAAGLDNAYHTPPPGRRADVINLSLGCQNCASAAEQAVYDEVTQAGVVVVAAAGNENGSVPDYPASYAGVISVSAVDALNARAKYSNSGPYVDVAAPGGDLQNDGNGDGQVDGIVSTWVDDSSGTRKPAYVMYQGTSMATPHVAGVLALMKSLCPSLVPAKVDELLAAGMLTTDLGAPGRDDQFGYGLIDAMAAVQAAQSECGKPVAPALQVTPRRLDFVPGQTAATLDAVRTGGSGPPLSVTGVTPSAAWLSATGPGTADGLGTWTIAADGSGLADGVYSATLAFAVSGGAAVSIPVTLQKGVTAGAGGVGYVYILLTDTAGTVKDARDGSGVNGRYAFAFTGVPDGTFMVVAGTDLNGDGDVCGAGEACGAWPTIAAPSVVVVKGADVDGVDFTVGFDAPISGGALAPKLAPLRR